MQNENTNQNHEYILGDDFQPYGEVLPFLVRPRDELQRPNTKYEKAYCWVYWLALIQDPAHTRWVLDNLEVLPTFQTTWGESREKRGRQFSVRKLRKNQKKTSTL
jgi:hypothetical protein